MKKLFTIIAVFLLGTVCFAQTSSLSSVNVRPITADYDAAPPTVTFEVTWPDDRDDNHRSKVWVFVDYRRIQDNAYTGKWLRADITVPKSAITATTGSTVTIEPDNTKGFWLQGWAGASSFAATVTVPVTVDLVGYAPQFGWCGWAIDGPPTAREETGYYSLHGTPPFIIQTHPTDAGQTVTTSSKEYTGCIYALTDLTGCPGEPSPMPAITDFTASTMTICAGESVTLTATATNAQRYSFDNGANWGSSSSTIVSPTTTTDYILKATRENGACTVTSPTTITVTVNPAPVVTAQGAPFERCGTGTIDLRVAVTVDNHPEDDVTIHWYDNDKAAGDPLATGATCSPTLSALNTYYYVGATVNATGCASTSLTKVTATVILDEGMIGGAETN